MSFQNSFDDRWFILFEKMTSIFEEEFDWTAFNNDTRYPEKVHWNIWFCDHDRQLVINYWIQKLNSNLKFWGSLDNWNFLKKLKKNIFSNWAYSSKIKVFNHSRVKKTYPSSFRSTFSTKDNLTDVSEDSWIFNKLLFISNNVFICSSFPFSWLSNYPIFFFNTVFSLYILSSLSLSISTSFLKEFIKNSSFVFLTLFSLFLIFSSSS